MKLFEPETGPVEVDKAAAEKFKEEVDAQIAALDAHIATLTGKENKKERTAKSKEASDLKVGKQYIDACKVVKGLEPKNGFFIVVGQAKPQAEAPKKEETEPAAAAAEEKKEKAKKEENAGISPAERSELEQLKKDIIERKSQLKAEGMNELKEKECPGSTQKDDKKEGKKKELCSSQL